ncbi:hypothetical protein Glove_103g107 [Diversispora epigaea]|uniref:Uncharacterized protein n=1 Tax=Diversispora epigaea TaxID=1348612 RepID=A0A397JDQ5_9GLOM|nr:hypothetical protein Glove_103g107 [Diversispora epigaea]
MVTFIILNHESKSHDADYHYTIVLYPGTEKYNMLKFVLDPFFDELKTLKEKGLEIKGVLWNFKLYFGSDWKFLAICLGLNDWHIEKNIDEISKNYNNINGHIFLSLFDMISIDHIIFDELHVFLRITDRLWEPSRAQLIRKLWDDFFLLYYALKNKQTNPIEFKKQAKDVLERLYIIPNDLPNQITPYIHALIFHEWELLAKHQLSTFFHKTLKNGGNILNKKSAIQEIIECKNRTLYYNYNSWPEPIKIKKLHINQKNNINDGDEIMEMR